MNLFWRGKFVFISQNISEVQKKHTINNIEKLNYILTKSIQLAQTKI